MKKGLNRDWHDNGISVIIFHHGKPYILRIRVQTGVKAGEYSFFFETLYGCKSSRSAANPSTE